MAVISTLAAYRLAISLRKRADSRAPSKGRDELYDAADALVELAEWVEQLQQRLNEHAA